MLVDLSKKRPDLTGKDAALWLERSNMIVNMNTVPGDQRSPFTTSGIRLGTPALTTRGLKPPQMNQVADWFDQVLESSGDSQMIEQIGCEVRELCKQFPMPH